MFEKSTTSGCDVRGEAGAKKLSAKRRKEIAQADRSYRYHFELRATSLAASR